jgi:hypothetical protein
MYRHGHNQKMLLIVLLAKLSIESAREELGLDLQRRILRASVNSS